MVNIISLLFGSNRAAGARAPLDVIINDTNGNAITSFGGSGGTADADGTAHVANTTLGTPMQGVYEAAPTTLADQTVGTVGLTSTRALRVSGSFSPPSSATSTLTNVADNAASVTLLASNAARVSFALYNDSTAMAFVKFGATASATSFVKKMAPGEKFSTSDVGVNYTGRIDAIWASAPGGAMRVTELT